MDVGNPQSRTRSAATGCTCQLLCSGGVDHINVQPDGSAWRCILERQLAINPLGSVIDPGFELLKSPLPLY